MPANLTTRKLVFHTFICFLKYLTSIKECKLLIFLDEEKKPTRREMKSTVNTGI